MSRNRLGDETSPYLLQHADNPVHWWAWGPEALAEAKAMGRPILLSVGYSACHWCHVMAHESFENPGIAGLMNALFINIKVDREERPDLDALYQAALAMMGQQGGWPLTMFLTPETEPFWGGTYFPATSRWGRAAFPDVLEGVAATFAREPDKVRHNADRLRRGLERLARSPGGAGLDRAFPDRAARSMLSHMDLHEGGTLGAPKFPQPGLLRFLWNAYLRTGDRKLRRAVTVSLDHILQGGITDHLGGGVMRYSTDAQWLVPHFEKMLYDNAQMIGLLSLVWKHEGNPLYRSRVEEAIGWLKREMTAEGGGFAAALDADSDGEEGLFYTWTKVEIEALLPPDQAAAFCRLYDVSEGGNWEGRAILHRNHRHGGDDDALPAQARTVLLEHRDKRVRPNRDHKVLADWNGMVIAGLVEAAMAFDRPDWLEMAWTAFRVVTNKMSRAGNRLFHSLAQGKPAHNGVVEDYAQMARAALALWQVRPDAALLSRAAGWLDAAHAFHWDETGGGYFTSASDADDILLRTKSSHDSVVPSGNGAMAEALALMALATGDAKWRERAAAVIRAFSAGAAEQPMAMTHLLGAFETLAAPVEVTVSGPAGNAISEELWRTACHFPRPPHLLRRIVEGAPQAVVCRASVCSAPVIEVRTLQAALAAG